jgi:hypothetical protein
MNIAEFIVAGLTTEQILRLMVTLLRAAPEPVFTKLFATVLQHTLRRQGQVIDEATLGRALRWFANGLQCARKHALQPCDCPVDPNGVEA